MRRKATDRGPLAGRNRAQNEGILGSGPRQVWVGAAAVVLLGMSYGCFSSSTGVGFEDGSVFLIFDPSAEGLGGLGGIVISTQVEGNPPERLVYERVPAPGARHDLLGRVLPGGTEISIRLIVYPTLDETVIARVDGNVVVRVRNDTPEGAVDRYIMERVL